MAPATLLVSIILAFAFSLCDANDFVCQYHNEFTKSLEIYCDYYQKRLPRNCTQVKPSLNTSDVTRLKIEGCNQSDVCGTSAMFQNIQQFDVSFSAYASLNCSGTEFRNLTEFNASFNELTAIPTKTLQNFPQLINLDLSHNYLSRIFNGDFQNFGRKLVSINLANNNLAFIDDNVFANFRHLELINLNYNRLTTLPTLNYLHLIKDVSIQENPKLTTIDCQFVSAMGRNRKVHLSWKYVKSFDGGKSCGTGWKFRAYETNHTEGLHHSFGLYNLHCSKKGFDHLESFVAGKRKFNNLGPMLKLLSPSVIKIDVSDNKLYELDASIFERFQRVNELNLSSTSLMAFDFNVLNVNYQQRLIRLDISENNLKVVENSTFLQDYESLADFNAAGNRIRNVDEMVRYLPMGIQRLNLADNHLNDVSAISRLAALEYLSLSNTDLLIFDPNPFKPLRRLVSLDLSRNNLSSVEFGFDVSEITQNFVQSMNLSIGLSVEITPDKSLFQTLSELTHLNLSGTHLQEFELEAVSSLQKLRTLDLSNNQLYIINLQALLNLTQLERLYLNNNDLTKLDNFNWPASLNISLEISRNHMPCAYLRELIYEHQNVNYISDPLEQKHGNDCRSSTQGISDFLDSVYEKVKFW